ncbi:FGGY carbohydrate kinase domain-containing protein [Lamellibrachia satsuma]|nr:FGGY carbohydrate kinase domain-containing protein [Lamellibrachia satsuma]
MVWAPPTLTLDPLSSNSWRRPEDAELQIGISTGRVNSLGNSPAKRGSSSEIETTVKRSIGSIPADDSELSCVPVASRLALICGTSTCHLAVSNEPVFVPGIWGPYYSAMIPTLWLSEGGQSATGKLIEHIVINHPAYSWVEEDALRRSVHPHCVLNEILMDLQKKEAVKSVTELTTDLHIWPDFHGNRSPLPHLTLRGMMCGLTLNSGIEDLAKKYLATIQALAYGTRHILETMQAAGHNIQLLFACGGLSKNNMFMQTHADVTGLPIVIPNSNESVLLGAAILGACASKRFHSIQEAMMTMTGSGQVVRPQKYLHNYHSKKYDVFLRMVEHQQEYDQIMKG